MGVNLGWCRARSSKPFVRLETVLDEFDSHTLPPPLCTWYNGVMRKRISLAAHVFTAFLAGSLLLTASNERAEAQPRPISQTRINEYAAALLKVHRALIEDGDLRRRGEKLDDFMRRIVIALPAESKDHYVGRIDSYFAALRNLSDRRKLCTATPALHDNSPGNVEQWKRAVRASAELPDRWEHVRTASLHPESGGPFDLVKGRSGMAAELTKTLLTIKTSFEALREARP